MRLHKIDSSRLMPGNMHFNPSVCIYRDKRLMAYRLEDRSAKSWAQIAICHLDNGWQPMRDTNRIVELPEPHRGTNHFEDPRLYVIGDNLFLTFIAACFNGKQHVAAQGICQINGMGEIAYGSILYPDIGNNHNYALTGDAQKLTSEKNWTLLPDGKNFVIIYSLNPLVIRHLHRGESKTKADTFWPHGCMSGSTPLIKIDEGLMLGCFHSFEHEAGHRKYRAGWYAIDLKKNRLFSNSRTPVLDGYIDEDDRRPAGSTWTPRAVFPCGLVDLGEEILLSYGWLDSTCRLGFFTRKEIFDSLVPITKWQEQREVLANPWWGIPGGFNCVIDGKELRARNWPTLMRTAVKSGIALQVLHDTLCARVPPQYKCVDWVDS